MAYTNAQKYGWKRPETNNTEIKSRFGFTSDFNPWRKGWALIFSFPKSAIYRKGIKVLVQIRGKEWERQRDEDFMARHGMTFEDSRKPENRRLFVARTCIIQKRL